MTEEIEAHVLKKYEILQKLGKPLNTPNILLVQYILNKSSLLLFITLWFIFLSLATFYAFNSNFTHKAVKEVCIFVFLVNLYWWLSDFLCR